jgi:transcriptional regulator with XRE-family HTH domain
MIPRDAGSVIGAKTVGVVETSSLSVATGKAIRSVRQARGLTLKQLERRSGGRFRASSVGSYERGERGISLERFVELCAAYAVDPGRLLSSIVNAVPSRPPVEPDATVSVRSGDLEILTFEAGLSLDGEDEGPVSPPTARGPGAT